MSGSSVAARPVVVKLGGTTLADQRHVLEEVAMLGRERHVVLVHGGGKRLTEWLDRLGVTSRWEQGRRVTDERALEVAVAVLRGIVNVELVAALRALGLDAVGVSGVDGGLLRGVRASGLGRVVTAPVVRAELLDRLFAAGLTPVVAPLACDETGQVCNVNADDAAAAFAAGLRASHLVLLTDTDGVRGGDGLRIAELTRQEAHDLIESGVIGGGMVPKVRAALAATAGGAGGTAIVDGSVPGVLARAIMGGSVGTRVS